MRILNWMQNKLNGGQGRNKPTHVNSKCHPKQEVHKEEFSDWPHALLLAIGTFGNHQSEQALDRNDTSENSHASRFILDFVEEEVGKFQKELRKLLSFKPIASSNETRGEDSSPPLDRISTFPSSSMEADQTNCEKPPCNDEDEFSRNTSAILNKAKELCMDKNGGMRQRSISFLLKKMFLCRGGFAPSPSLRDPIPESRMEKLLWEILHKKILSKTSASSSPRRYLANKNASKSTSANDQEQENTDNGSTWVKTDSDFIVLEM